MVSNRMDRVSGKAKEWAGRAAGNSRLQRKGQIQSVLAGAMIKVRSIAKKIIGMIQERRRR